MDNPVPDLAPRLAKALAAFRESGVEPTDAELVWLASLRAKCDNPTDGSVPWVMGAPLEYGGIKWHPMHRLAESWFLRAFKLFDGDDILQISAFLFAHAHSGIGDKTVREYMSDESMRAKLNDWRDGLAIQDDQIPELCETLRGMDGQGEFVPDLTDGKVEDIEPMAPSSVPQNVAALCKAFPGVSPEFWLTDISSNDSMLMLATACNESGWAESPLRRAAVANWLKAIKWVWRNHTNG